MEVRLESLVSLALDHGHVISADLCPLLGGIQEVYQKEVHCYTPCLSEWLHYISLRLRLKEPGGTLLLYFPYAA